MEKYTGGKGFGKVQIAYYEHGVKYLNTATKGQKPPDSGGSREAIKGWSKASRRRLREWMLTHTPLEGFELIAATLTVPGPVLDLETTKRLFERYRQRVKRKGWGCVWRLELQKRGQPHWHVMFAMPRADVGEVRKLWLGCLSGVSYECPTQGLGFGEGERWKYTLAELWDRYRACVPVGSEEEGQIETVQLDQWPSAFKVACQVDTMDDKIHNLHGHLVANQARWMRYLMDHTSKSKQEQIAEGWGRHWGILNRGAFCEVEPDSVLSLPEPAAVIYRRLVNRLRTPQIKCPLAPFGRKLGHVAGRLSARGSRVIFCRIETHQKMAEWAMTEWLEQERAKVTQGSGISEPRKRAETTKPEGPSLLDGIPRRRRPWDRGKIVQGELAFA